MAMGNVSKLRPPPLLLNTVGGQVSVRWAIGSAITAVSGPEIGKHYRLSRVGSTVGTQGSAGSWRRWKRPSKQLDSDVDYLAWQLRRAVLDDLGLGAALTHHVNSWSEHFDIHAELHMSGMASSRLTNDLDTALYRIMQEALNNVVKHARARKAAGPGWDARARHAIAWNT